MEVEIPGSGKWFAGELDWPARGRPTSVWFLRRRDDSTHHLIAPWFDAAPVTPEGLVDAFHLAQQRLWIGPMQASPLHFAFVDEWGLVGEHIEKRVLVRGMGVERVVSLPRDVPLGLLTEQELATMVMGAPEQDSMLDGDLVPSPDTA